MQSPVPSVLIDTEIFKKRRRHGLCLQGTDSRAKEMAYVQIINNNDKYQHFVDPTRGEANVPREASFRSGKLRRVSQRKWNFSPAEMGKVRPGRNNSQRHSGGKALLGAAEFRLVEG